MKKLLFTIAMVVGFSSVSQAGLLLEPYLGYEAGKYSMSGFDAKPSGTVLGLRLAYSIPMFWFGIDASSSNGKINPETSGTNNDAYTRSVLGAGVGVEFPILLRAWVGYGFSNKLANKDVSNSDLTGTSTKFGIGFTGLPLVSLNLEMITDSYDKVNDVAVSGISSSGYVLSVSLPLDL